MVEDTQPWEKYNSKDEYNCIVNDIADAIKHQRLVFFIGAGIPRIQGYANWNGYIDKLLNYWEEKISEDKKDISQYNMYINSIDKIKTSNMDKRRKVDFLNQILKKVYGEDYKNKRLNFEKEYFQNNKIRKPNPVLEDLSEMNALYFTTNYDNEIENHLNSMRSVGTEVQDMDKLSTQIDKGNVTLFTVVHLHGTPDSDFENFINSSISYKNHYYIDNESLTAIRKWINEKNLLMVFLGSSMEEEEVLSLLPDKENKTKHIAFMDSGNVYSDVDKYILEMKEKFFEENNNTRIFWYGDKYTCLPPFIRDLRNRVQSILKINDDNFYKFRRHSTKEKDIIKIFQNTSANKLDVYFNRLSKDLYKSRSKAFFDSNLLDNFSENITYSIWKMLLYQLHKNELNNEQLERIIDYLLNNEKVFLNYAGLETFLKYFINQTRVPNSKKKSYCFKFAKKIGIEKTPFMQIPDIAGWKIVNSVINNEHLLFLYKNLNYNLSIDAEKELFDFFKNNENNLTFQLFSPGSSGEYNNMANILSEVINNNKLTINGKDWETNLNEKFYKNSFFIKILMVVYNQEKTLPDNVVKLILKNVDYSDYGLGEVFGDFLKKYADNSKIDPDKYYNRVRGGFVNERTIINESDLSNLNNKEILTKLRKNRLSNSTKDDLEEKTIGGTVKFFKKILESNKEKLQDKLINLLLNNVNQLFNASDRFIEFKELYEIILKKEFVSRSEFIKLSNNILDTYESEYGYFNDIDYEIFNILINDDDTIKKTIDVFLQLNINKFPFNDSFNNGFAATNFLASTDVVYYFRIFDKLLNISNNYKNILRNKVKNIQNDNIQQIMIGKYCDLYQDVEFNNCNNLFGLLLNTPFSNEDIDRRYVIRNNIERFNKTSVQFLRRKYIPSDVKTWVIVTLLRNINPNTLDGIEWENVDYRSFIYKIICSDDTFKYEEEWFIKLIKERNNESIQYLLSLFKSEKVNIEKLSRAYKKIENYIGESSNKVNILDDKLCDTDKNTTQSRYLNLLRLLLVNNRIGMCNLNIIEKLVANFNDTDKIEGILKLIKEKYGDIFYSQLLGKYYKI